MKSEAHPLATYQSAPLFCDRVRTQRVIASAAPDALARVMIHSTVDNFDRPFFRPKSRELTSRRRLYFQRHMTSGSIIVQNQQTLESCWRGLHEFISISLIDIWYQSLKFVVDEFLKEICQVTKCTQIFYVCFLAKQGDKLNTLCWPSVISLVSWGGSIIMEEHRRQRTHGTFGALRSFFWVTKKRPIPDILNWFCLLFFVCCLHISFPVTWNPPEAILQSTTGSRKIRCFTVIHLVISQRFKESQGPKDVFVIKSFDENLFSWS